MHVKLKGDDNWYPVTDVVDQGPGNQNIYLLLGKGRVTVDEIETLEFD